MIYTHTITRHGLIHLSDGSVHQAVFQIPIWRPLHTTRTARTSARRRMATPEPKSQEQGNENQALPKLKTTESPSKAPASIIDSPVRTAYTKSIHKNI